MVCCRAWLTAILAAVGRPRWSQEKNETEQRLQCTTTELLRLPLPFFFCFCLFFFVFQSAYFFGIVVQARVASSARIRCYSPSGSAYGTPRRLPSPPPHASTLQTTASNRLRWGCVRESSVVLCVIILRFELLFSHSIFPCLLLLLLL